MQALLGYTLEMSTRSQATFAIWVSLLIFCEGAHFVVVPTALKQIFGPSASSIYGFIFTFTGLANLIMFLMVSNDVGQNYALIF